MKDKITSFFTTKIKLKVIVSTITVSFLFLLSFLMATPGIGLETNKFIKIIEKQIEEIMPHGMYVIDGTDIIYE